MGRKNTRCDDFAPKEAKQFLSVPKKYQLPFKGGGCYGGGHLTVQVGVRILAVLMDSLAFSLELPWDPWLSLWAV